MIRSLFQVAALLALSTPSFAAEPGAVVSLFDGQTLDGWVVTDCEVEVEGGSLVLKGGNGLVRSHHRYQDFILELDWKPRQASMYDSGIYIRADLPTEGKPWPSRYQINLKDGFEGNVTSIKPAASTGLVRTGDWNHFKITVRGTTAQLEINGKPAWTTDLIENPSGHIGFQAEVPLGGQFEFKNIRVTELGFESLFNGRDLSGWEGADADAALCWKVEDGLLICTGAKGPWLRTQREVDDFNFRCDYKLKSGGNSGVYVRVPKNGNHHGPQSGLEVQMLDDFAEKHKNLKPYQYSSGLYDIVGPSKQVTRQPELWNSIEINCRGQRYTITHNGHLVIDADAEQFPALKERLTSGFLGLQNHSETVWFRNLRLGPAQ